MKITKRDFKKLKKKVKAVSFEKTKIGTVGAITTDLKGFDDYNRSIVVKDKKNKVTCIDGVHGWSWTKKGLAPDHSILPFKKKRKKS